MDWLSEFLPRAAECPRRAAFRARPVRGRAVSCGQQSPADGSPAAGSLLAGRRVLPHGHVLAHGHVLPHRQNRAGLDSTHFATSPTETFAMKRTRQDNAARRNAQCAFVASALAIALTCVLAVAGAHDWMGALWLVAVLCTIAATFFHALWRGLRHRDWSAFACQALPRFESLPTGDDDSFATRTGRYAHLRIRADNETLVREGDRFLQDHDHSGSLG